MDGVKDSLSGFSEPIVKIEPPEDVKDSIRDIFLPSSCWTFLLKTVRYKYQKDHGRKMDYSKMTQLLLSEVEQLMDDVATFVHSCCNSQINADNNVIDVSQRLSAVFKSSTRLQVNDYNVIPNNYKDSIFGPLHKKEIDIMDVEQSMMHSVFQEEDDDDDDLDNLTNFPDLPDDFKIESPPSLPIEPFPPMSTSGL